MEARNVRAAEILKAEATATRPPPSLQLGVPWVRPLADTHFYMNELLEDDASDSDEES